MSPKNDPATASRIPLSRERVLRAAIALADRGGIESVSMRKLAQELGVEAMSLYNHVESKDDILDGVVDAIVGEIEMKPGGSSWKSEIRERAMAAREVIKRHPWVSELIVARPSISPVMLRYMDSVTGIMLAGGFSPDLAHSAMHAIGSRILGFTQELFDAEDIGPEMAAVVLEKISPEEYPHISSIIQEIDHDDDVEFEFGLDLILDGLERLLPEGADETVGEPG